MHTPTPEPEPEAPTNKYSSPLSSPEPEPPKKDRYHVTASQPRAGPSSSVPQQHSGPAVQDENEEVDNEVQTNAGDRRHNTHLDEDIEAHGADNPRPEKEEYDAEGKDPDDSEGENDIEKEDESEDEDELDQFQDPEATAYALSAALGFATEAEK